jgi:hypothetical protein
MTKADKFLIVILIVAALIFIGGVIAAYVQSVNGGTLDKTLVSFITAAGGLLATNLGAFLGIKVGTGKNIFAIPDDLKQKIQMYAAYGYFIVLVITAIVYLFLPNKENAVDILPQFTNTLFGVLVGAIAIILAR